MSNHVSNDVISARLVETWDFRGCSEGVAAITWQVSAEGARATAGVRVRSEPDTSQHLSACECVFMCVLEAMWACLGLYFIEKSLRRTK